MATPEIFNTDQGSQFTSDDFTGILKKADITISMDGRVRALDNVFVERLWRSVKYERVYLHNYENVREEVRGIGNTLIFTTTIAPISLWITKLRQRYILMVFSKERLYRETISLRDEVQPFISNFFLVQGIF